MSRFTPLTVTSLRKTTDDCVIVSLAVPQDKQSAFAYKQGQYLTLRAEIDNEQVQRSYSLCSSPLDNEWQVGIKKVPGGLFSTFANEVLRVGDILESLPANGKFYVDCNPEKKQEYVCFAAGSGITPMYSIIKTHLQAEPKSTFKLFYINRTVSSIILKEELEALKNVFMDRLEIFHILTKQNRAIPLFNGRLDEEKLTTIFKTLCDIDQIDHYFICGPEKMIFSIKDFLEEKGVQKEKIHFELFTAPGEKKIIKQQLSDELKGKSCTVTIIEGGKSMEFELALGGDNLLDAALNNSADLPYACKGGVCCTCRAKLLEGKVDMAVTYGLEQDELDSGYILTCQALPLTDKVVVDFDA